MRPYIVQWLHAKRNIAAAGEEEGVVGLGKMFSDPHLLGKLASNPKTSHLLADQNFVNQLKMIQANPQLAGK
jgi:hypothetical protein